MYDKTTTLVGERYVRYLNKPGIDRHSDFRVKVYMNYVTLEYLDAGNWLASR